MNLSITGKKYSAIQNDKKINQNTVKTKINNPVQLGSKIQSKPINTIKKS
jgi:hypothetical protein